MKFIETFCHQACPLGYTQNLITYDRVTLDLFDERERCELIVEHDNDDINVFETVGNGTRLRDFASTRASAAASGLYRGVNN